MTGYRTWGTQCFSVRWLFCRHFSVRFSFMILLCVFSHRIHSLQGKIRSMTQRHSISFVKLHCFINDQLLDNTLTSVARALLNIDVNVVCVHSEENRYFQNFEGHSSSYCSTRLVLYHRHVMKFGAMIRILHFVLVCWKHICVPRL